MATLRLALPAAVSAIAVSAGRSSQEMEDEIALLAGVFRVQKSARPYLLTQRAARPAGTIVDVGGVRIGGDEPVVIAGPCVVESLDATLAAAQAVRHPGRPGCAAVADTFWAWTCTDG